MQKQNKFLSNSFQNFTKVILVLVNEYFSYNRNRGAADFRFPFSDFRFPAILGTGIPISGFFRGIGIPISVFRFFGSKIGKIGTELSPIMLKNFSRVPSAREFLHCIISKLLFFSQSNAIEFEKFKVYV